MRTVRQLQTVDVHVAGETGRVLLDSHLLVPGETMVEKLRYCREHLQELRRFAVHEPRGFPGMLGALVTAPVNPGSDFGVIILEQADFAPMSGANLMCAVTALVETGRLAVTEPKHTLTVDTAAGVVRAEASVADGQVTSVTIENVASFVWELGVPLVLPEFGEVPVDVSYGGQFYVQSAAEDLGIELVPENGLEIIRAAHQLLAAAREAIPVQHPEEPSLNEINLPLIYGAPQGPGSTSRGVVVMPTGRPSLDDPRSWSAGSLDRSPSGTGTSARMATELARGGLIEGHDFVQESILGTTFTGTVRGRTRVGEREALLPNITGRGWVTGTHQLRLSPDDPFPHGFVL
ncbi:MAG: proline racemase family protein [Micrococcaceae bacterium]